MTSILTYEAAGKSVVGKVRENNQDRFLVKTDRPTLMIVADGMGGHAKGEVASTLAVFTIKDYFGLVNKHSRGAHGDDLKELIGIAHKQIRQQARIIPEQKGMGTTVVVATPYHKVEDGDIANYIAVGYVGDSRCYGLRDKRLKQFTRDHSMGPSELTRALGRGILNPAEVTEIRVRVGDKFLLCSDGLTNMVTDAEISATLDQDLPMDVLVDQLVQKAMDNGGKDNITVVVMRAKEPDNLSLLKEI